jgi:hypothetical protein
MTKRPTASRNKATTPPFTLCAEIGDAAMLVREAASLPWIGCA